MNQLSETFQSLGDATRLRILRLLSEAPLNVSELVSLIGVGQPTVSHHLGKLKSLGLVTAQKQAGFTFYSLAIDDSDGRWPLIALAREERDDEGDLARLKDVLRSREDRVTLNERLLEPGQSWFLWAQALASMMPALEVADFGCGSGVLSVSIARWAKKVVAIDKNSDALAQAKERAAREKVKNIQFLAEDLKELSLRARSQDVVVCSQSLHHVDSPLDVLREAARILRPGGRIIVLELMPHSETWVRERLGHVHLGFDPDRLEGELVSAGFKKVARDTHARNADSTFRVFLLTAETPQRDE